MTILVVDDERVFKEGFGTIDTIYCKTAEDAIAAVEGIRNDGNSIEEIWLDFDLGVKDGEFITVMPFVHWLEYENMVGIDAPVINRIYIHTMNPSGRKHLQSLNQFYWVRDALASNYFIVPD